MQVKSNMKSIKGVTEATLSKYVKMFEKAGVKKSGRPRQGRPRQFSYSKDLPNEKLILKYEFFHQKKDMGKLMRRNTVERDLFDTIIGFYDLNFYLIAVNEGTDMEKIGPVLPVDKKVDFKKSLMTETNYDKIRSFVDGEIQRCVFALNIDFGLYNRAISRGMRGGHPYRVRGDIVTDLYYIFVNTLDLMKGKGGVDLYEEEDEDGSAWGIGEEIPPAMQRKLKEGRLKFRKRS